MSTKKVNAMTTVCPVRVPLEGLEELDEPELLDDDPDDEPVGLAV